VLRVWSLADARLERAFATGVDEEPSALSPDGELVALVDGQDAVEVRSLRDGASIRRFARPADVQGGPTALAFSPAENLLAIGYPERLVFLPFRH